MVTRLCDDCCGCGVCVSVCPQKCLDLKEDEEGFLFPVQNTNKCVECGLCEKKCPVINVKKMENDINQVYGMISNNQKNLMSSSSGGVFGEIAKEFLKNGGFVYGASFSDDFLSVKHICVETYDDLNRIKGSKYVQSIVLCFKEIREKLDRGINILFSGTPCQVAGLKMYLGKEYVNLICVELVCHGVPSAYLWRKYLYSLKEKHNDSEIVSINFRHKENGWNSFGLKVDTNKEQYYCDKDSDSFMQMFLRNYCLRYSCYNCKFKSKHSLADISIGDFWGVGRLNLDIDIKNGVSLVVVHSHSGSDIINTIKEKTTWFDTTFEEAVHGNFAYLNSVIMPKERNKFYTDLREKSWKYMVKHYTKDDIVLTLKKELAKTKIGKYIRYKILHRDLQSEGGGNGLRYGILIKFNNKVINTHQ